MIVAMTWAGVYALSFAAGVVVGYVVALWVRPVLVARAARARLRAAIDGGVLPHPGPPPLGHSSAPPGWKCPVKGCELPWGHDYQKGWDR